MTFKGAQGLRRLDAETVRAIERVIERHIKATECPACNTEKLFPN
ncbi:hypothetical protein [Leptolyngbya sp. FACHB-36]|nr:hypothetical protein [Leptolyngbya sp. FACHB-36]